MPFNALLLPLLGGYVFVSSCYSTKYLVKRLGTQQLLFVSALAGVILLVISYLVCFAVIAWLPSVHATWKSLVPHKNTGVTIGALLLGCVGPAVINSILDLTPRNYEWHGNHAILESNDYFEHLAHKSVSETRQIRIELKNGKWYVGFVLEPFNPEHERKYITVLPMLSGHRDGNSRVLQTTTNYASWYEKLIERLDEDSSESSIHKFAPDSSSMHVEDFKIIIPVSEILTAHLFDTDAFSYFNAELLGANETMGVNPETDQPAA